MYNRSATKCFHLSLPPECWAVVFQHVVIAQVSRGLKCVLETSLTSPTIVASILAKDPNKHRYLVKAAQLGRGEQVGILLQAGADVHDKDDAALRLASEDGHADVVQVLLAAGADVGTHNNAALLWASREGYAEQVGILLHAGADVGAGDNAALRWASRTGHADVVELLLEAGADVGARDNAAPRFAARFGGRRHLTNGGG